MRLVLIISTLLVTGLSNGPPNLQEKDAVDNSESFLQPADFALAEKMPVTIPTNAQLDANLNAMLFEGDIDGIPTGVQTSPVLRSRRGEPALTDNNVIQRSSINLASFPNGLWPQGRVPYVMEPGMTTQQRTVIAQAVDEFNRLTCITIVPREARDMAFVFLRRSGAAGCSSFIGRTGGNQTVNLAVGCYTKGIVVHELMHAIGFFHEQSRPDRDRFVRIAFENIRPETRHNFAMHNMRIIDAQGMPYDYGSLMHYHRTAFSINGRDTIVPTNPNAPIGNRSGMSAIDAAKVNINLLYKCPRR
ncbi:hypothetical protein PRIPAC_77629 [Pristionchus pacificus]|uniref:Metalloendopeptidase n=1 Tax=Pristionchus pacificus TaxID=54126 RepID=A0A2A6BH16_PRIPA|nr:hypothetical protein PRIPAC_77629 [Pristionchus pacificus]|eukprot:PDM65182.1 metallopeptidase [Pristionchus pacificus]